MECKLLLFLHKCILFCGRKKKKNENKKKLTYFPKFRQMTLGFNVRRKK